MDSSYTLFPMKDLKMIETTAPTAAATPLSLSQLPAEVLLEILPYIPYSPHSFSCLCLTCGKLNVLVKHHERGLVRDIKNCQFGLTSLQLFPSLKTDTWEGLSTLHRRLDTLDDLHEQWLKITSYGPELDWLKGRWESIHKAGLLLLYRIQDAGSYPYKVALINGLPATSLACLYFKLISSIKILRIYGPDPINGTFSAGDIMARSDIELAFEEMLLQHGPDFFVAMLKTNSAQPLASQPQSASWAIQYVLHTFISNALWENRSLTLSSALESEVAGLIERQLPSPDGTPKPPTLTSCMRRAFAAATKGHISQNVGKMWEILSGTVFDDLDVDEGKMIKVVNGEELKGGMKRIF